jgi:hypothetical protein
MTTTTINKEENGRLGSITEKNTRFQKSLVFPSIGYAEHYHTDSRPPPPPDTRIIVVV